MTQTAATYPKTSDIKCLRCGAMNVPENHVCGRCGANLPLIYDEEGQVFDRRREELKAMLEPVTRRRMNPQSTAWVLRIGVILFALFMAFWIMHRR